MELRARLSHGTRRVDFNRSYRELSTNTAARAGVEVAADAGWVDGYFGFQPDCHRIARGFGIILYGFGPDRQNLADIVNDALREEKPDGEIQIAAGCAHGNRERGAVQTELERLLNGKEVGTGGGQTALHGLNRGSDRNRGHPYALALQTGVCARQLSGRHLELLLTSLPQHSGRSGKLHRSHPPPRAL